jgi:hypothetical protein
LNLALTIDGFKPVVRNERSRPEDPRKRHEEQERWLLRLIAHACRKGEEMKKDPRAVRTSKTRSSKCSAVVYTSIPEAPR